MTTAGARYWLSRYDLNVLPLIGREIVDRGLVGPTALLESSKDYHLCGFYIDHSCVLVSKHDLVTSSPDQ